MNNVSKINKKSNHDKELATETVNLKFTISEKEYYKMVAVINKTTMTGLIRMALENSFPKIDDLIIGNLKELNIKID